MPETIEPTEHIAIIKHCPVCNTTLFEDMDTCYGCMYKFGSNPELEMGAAQMQSIQTNQELNLQEVVPIFREQPGFQDGCLFNKFLVEFHGFLGKFLADCKVNIS